MHTQTHSTQPCAPSSRICCAALTPLVHVSILLSRASRNMLRDLVPLLREKKDQWREESNSLEKEYTRGEWSPHVKKNQINTKAKLTPLYLSHPSFSCLLCFTHTHTLSLSLTPHPSFLLCFTHTQTHTLSLTPHPSFSLSLDLFLSLDLSLSTSLPIPLSLSLSTSLSLSRPLSRPLFLLVLLCPSSHASLFRVTVQTWFGSGSLFFSSMPSIWYSMLPA